MLVVNWKVPTPWLMKGSNVQVLKVEDIDKIIKNYFRDLENILNRIKIRNEKIECPLCKCLSCKVNKNSKKKPNKTPKSSNLS